VEIHPRTRLIYYLHDRTLCLMCPSVIFGNLTEFRRFVKYDFRFGNSKYSYKRFLISFISFLSAATFELCLSGLGDINKILSHRIKIFCKYTILRNSDTFHFCRIWHEVLRSSSLQSNWRVYLFLQSDKNYITPILKTKEFTQGICIYGIVYFVRKR
jgi:hypothetical protein